MEILRQRPVPSGQAEPQARADQPQFEIIGQRRIGPPPERTWGEAASDLAVSFGAGAGGLLEMGGTLYGLATGDMDNVAKRHGQRTREFYQERKSPGLQAREELRQQKVDAADGQLGKFWTMIKETATDPALYSSFMAEQVPNLLAAGAGGRVVGLGARALGAGEAAAGAAATGGAIGTGAVLQGSEAGGDAYERLLEFPTTEEQRQSLAELLEQEPDDVHAETLLAANGAYQKLLSEGLSENEARERVALELARLAFIKSAAVSAAVNAVIPGARSVERVLGGGARAGAGGVAGAVRGAAKGFAGETLAESVDEGFGRYAANVAVGEVDPEQDSMEGVGEALAEGALFGPFGAVSGAVEGASPEQDVPVRDRGPRLVREGEHIDDPEEVGPFNVPEGAVEGEMLLGAEEEAAATEAAAEPQPTEEISRFQFMRRDSGSSPQLEVLPLTQERFLRFVRPYLHESSPGFGATLEEWQAKHPEHTHVAIMRTSPNAEWKPHRTGTRDKLTRFEGDLARQVRPVEDFDSDEAREWSQFRQSDLAGRASGAVNPRNDSLLAAISKLGGLNRQIAESEGVDPAEFGRLGAGIQRVFTQGGRTPEELAELLVDYGYPVVDDGGVFSGQVLMDRVFDELLGHTVSSGEGIEAQAEREARAREIDEMRRAREEEFDPDLPQYEEIAAELESLAYEPEYPPEFDDEARSFADLAILAREYAGEDAVEDALMASTDEQAARELWALIRQGRQEESDAKGAAAEADSRPQPTPTRAPVAEGEQDAAAQAGQQEAAEAVADETEEAPQDVGARGEVRSEEPAGEDATTAAAEPAVEPAAEAGVSEDAPLLARLRRIESVASGQGKEELQTAISAIERGADRAEIRASLENASMELFGQLPQVADAVDRLIGEMDRGLVGEALPSAGEPTASEPKKTRAKPAPSPNAVFTEDAAAKAREILRKKLSQARSGVDPEFLQAGITLAGYHIERGARTFAAYSKAMIEDLGEVVRPYLKSWYMAVKYDPRAADFAGEMDSAATVETTDVDALTDAPTQEDIDAAAHEAATSPENDLPQPSQAQKEANGEGNYKLGDPIKLHGVTWRVENPEGSYRTNLPTNELEELVGSYRRGRKALNEYRKGNIPEAFDLLYSLAGAIKGDKAAAGKLNELLERSWFNRMPAHYARALEVEGADGDKLDAFLGPQAADQALPIYVVDTNRLDGKGFDEHKVMIGFESEAAARKAFLESYSEDVGPKILAGIATMNSAEFQEWARSDQVKKPAASAAGDITSPSSREGDAPATGAVGADSEPLRLARFFSEHFAGGEGFRSIVAARRAASEQLGRKVEPGTPDAKMVDEAVELGATLRGRELVQEGGEPRAIYRRLVQLYDLMPKLSTRTSTSVAQQAYSTPLPLSYLAAQAAGITQESTVYEPSAGNGALLITADPAKVFANEFNEDRAANLQATLPGASVFEFDAARWRPAGVEFDVVIGNPPFGAVKEEGGRTRRFQVDDRYETREIDHAISMKALEVMKDDGAAVLIVGSVAKTAQSEEARSDAYNAKSKREFYLTLYGQYNVVDHFTVPGELYEKQGAGWPVDVIVIRGRGRSERPVPAVRPPRILESWEALAEVLDAQYDRAPGGVRPTVRDGDRGQPEPAASDGRDSARGRTGRTDRQPSATEAQQRPGVRDGRVDGEPRDTRPSQPQPRDSAQAETRADAGRRARRDPVKIEGENARQVAYQPSSRSSAMGTLVPVNMQTAIHDALEKLAARVGDIDSFVADRLGYPAEELSKYFGAEQVDALALALENMERGSGFIVGDQTGIGKGRVVAAILRYAMRAGRTPIFVTEKPNLYGDMYRDLTDIGIQDMLGREPSILMTNANEDVPLDDEGERRLKTPGAGAHNKHLTEIADSGTLGDYDVIFTTYTQMQTYRGDVTPRMLFLEAMARGGIVVFDESHNAGGSAQQESQREEGKKEEINRASFARQISRIAHGVVYSSATYAKRPEVMDLYASTDMRLAVSDISKLGAAIHRGGVPMQQVVASMLSAAGQYVRRERSFDGVVYNTPEVKVSRETYERFSHVLASIQEFSERFVPKATKNLDKRLRAEGRAISHDGSTGGAGARSTSFTSVMHNTIDQMLLAIMADAAADGAIRALKNDEKPVITVANTMGSFIKDYVEGRNINPGDKIEITFNTLLARYLERTRWVTIRRPFMKKGEKGEKYYLSDDDIGSSGVRFFEDARELILNQDFSALPVSPIDHIRRRIIDAGYTVGEITGRDMVLDYRPDGSYFRVRSSRERSIRGRRKAISGFNSGQIDAMILNQAGSTGLSLHASETFKDQRKRRMIIAQAEKNIDTHMQMLGRVHRTGQVVPPEYDQLVADVPAVKRPAAVLAKKMASLNANTTASRGGALTAENVSDFMNSYGDEVVARVMVDMPDVHWALGSPLTGDGDGLASEDAARKVTGRIPLLPLEQQEQVYAIIESEYKEYVAQKEAAGESILEAKTLPLDARTLDRKQVVAPQGVDSPFADGVYVEEVDVKRLGKPYTTTRVLEMIAEELEVVLSAADGDVLAELRRLHGLGRSAMQRAVSEAESEFRVYRREVIDEIGNEETRRATEVRLDGQLTRFKELMAVAHVGQSVRLETPNGNFYGVVTKVQRKGQAKNPLAMSAWKVTLAMADSSRHLTVSLSQLDTAVQPDSIMARTRISPVQNIMDDMPVIQAFDELQTEAREQRTIVTGNLLAGFEHVGGRGAILNFTDSDGAVRQGILMPRAYNYEKDQSEKPVPLRSSEQVLAFIESGNRVVSADRDVTITEQAGAIRFDVASAKGRGGKYYLDPDVLRALGGDFIKVGNTMRADVPRSQAPEIIEAMRLVGAAFQAVDNLKAARKIAGEVTSGDADVQLRRGAATVAGRGLGARVIKPFVDEIIGKWQNLPAEVTVTTRRSLSTVPAHIRESLERLDPQRLAMGAHDRKGRRVFLFADNIPSLHEAERVLVHEIKGHYGTQAFLGDGYREFAEMVRQRFPELATAEARSLGADMRKTADRMRVADEVVARIAEQVEAKTATAAMQRLWDRFQAMFVRGLRALGFRHYQPTKAELRNLVRQASRWVERGGEPEPSAATDVTQTPEFKRWFGESKVVDANGKPLVVYHGTGSDFSVFSDEFFGDSTGFGDLGEGFYFSNRTEVASSFAEDAFGDTPNVMPVYLSIQNPANNKVMLTDEVQRALQDDMGFERVRDVLTGMGYDGIIWDHKNEGGIEYVAFRPEQIKSATGNRGTFDPNNPRIDFSLGEAPGGQDFLTNPDNNIRLATLRSEEEQRRQSGFLAAVKAGQPLDRAFRLPFQFVGTIDDRGRWKMDARAKAFGKKVAAEARQLMKSKRFRWLNHMAGVVHAEVVQKYGIDDQVTRGIEAAKRGLIDRYGLDQDYIRRDFERQADERGMLMQALGILKTLMDENVGPKEAEVLYRMLTGGEVTDEHMGRLAAPIRKAIDQLGAEAVDLGLISRESYERNRGAYLHRTYQKHESDLTGLARFARDAMQSRRRRIRGNQFKGRGLFLKVDGQRMARDLPGDWWEKKAEAGKADASLIGRKILVLDKVAAPGLDTMDMPGIAPKHVKERITERIYWPADAALPAKYAALENRGEFEVRDVAGGQFVLWRDYTKEELAKMGEIVDARYAIAKTYMQMAHDLSTGRFFKDIAENPDWAQKQDPTGGQAEDAKPGRIAKVLDDAEWVRVPDTKIPKSNTYRYGALAGMYVRAEIWRDLDELQRMQKGGFWREVMKQWKLSKTARNVVVHWNNVMSNILLMDMIDVTASDFVRGFRSYREQDSYYKMAVQYGALGTDFISQEIRDSVLKPILRELEQEKLDESRTGLWGVMTRVGTMLRNADEKMIRWYQVEDEVFRMAIFMKELSRGATPEEAALQARDQMLNYDIRAPWINALRESVLPFISYTYRAVPVVAQSLYDRPWKIAKYATVAYMVNALGYLATGDWGDEDEERAALRDTERGRTWLGVYRMIRMPFKDRWDNPIYLDIRRWIPAGDVFDFNQGSSALPVPAPLQFGGPLMIGMELMLNRAAFTGEDIVDHLVDSPAEKAGKWADFLWKSAMPSAPWIPGSWYASRIWGAATGELDPMMREYSVPLAISSSFGLKLKPHDVTLQRRYLMMQMDAVERRLNEQLQALSRDLQRRRVSRAHYDAEVEKIMAKRLRLAEERAKLAPR